MKPPENAVIHDEPNSVWWIDESGIFCSVSKRNPVEQTREDGIKRLEEFKKTIGDKKVCLLMDISEARPNPRMESREERDFAAGELAKIVKAMAIISRNPLGRMLANLFFSLKPPPYPMKMFTDEHEAKEWLKQHL